MSDNKLTTAVVLWYKSLQSSLSIGHLQLVTFSSGTARKGGFEQ